MVCLAAGRLRGLGLLPHAGHFHRLFLRPAEGAAGLWLLADAPGPAAGGLYPGLPPGAAGAPAGDLRPAAAPAASSCIVHGLLARVLPWDAALVKTLWAAGEALTSGGVLGGVLAQGLRARCSAAWAPPSSVSCWPSCWRDWGPSTSPWPMWRTGSSTGPAMSMSRRRSRSARAGASGRSGAAAPEPVPDPLPPGGHRHPGGGRPPGGQDGPSPLPR